MQKYKKMARLGYFSLIFFSALYADNAIEHSHESHAHDSHESHSYDGESHAHSHDSHESHTHDSHLESRYAYLHAYDSHTHAKSKQVDFATISARIGIFGKSSALASKDDNANRDNYAMLYSHLLFQSNPFANTNNALNGFTLGVGAVAYVPFYSNKAPYINSGYIASNFVANTAYLGYVKDFERVGVELLGGRFDRELEWVGHSMQGVFGRVTLPFGSDNSHSAQIYAIWVNEQAHTMREMSSDFNLYKELYPKENLFAGGVNLSFGLAQNARFHFEHYAYYLSDYFGVYGGKAVLEIDFDGEKMQDWKSKTIAHGAFLYSNYGRIHAGHNHSSHNHSHEEHTHLDTDSRGDTYFVFVEQEFAYKDFVYFGAGFQHIGKSVFEIANLGGTSRFEAHEGAGFGVIRPGAIHSGTQITNAYNAQTNTYYGFVGARFGSDNQFALEAMGRNSASSAKTQSAFSLGLKYAFPYGFEIGGIGVFMIDKHAHDDAIYKINRSFGKAYIEWNF